MRQEAIEASVAAAANKVTTGAGVTAVIGGLTANEIAAFGGLLVAIIGLLVQWYYKRKADKRDAELHTERLKDLRDGHE